MGAESSIPCLCLNPDEQGPAPLEEPTEKDIKKVFKQYCDDRGEVAWKDVADCIDDLPGWDGCGDRWSEEELGKWKRKKPGKPINQKLFAKIVHDALERQEEWNSLPLGAQRTGKVSKKRERELRRLRVKLEDTSRKDLKKQCAHEGLKCEGSSPQLVNRLMKFHGEVGSDTESDTDSSSDEPLIRVSSVHGSTSPSSSRGSPRQRKQAAKYEKMSRAQLKKLCKDNRLKPGSKEEMVARLTKAALNESSDPGTASDSDSDSDSSSATTTDSDDSMPSSRSGSSEKKKIYNKFERLDVHKLRDLCRGSNLNDRGTHATLVKRLVDAEIQKRSGSPKEKDPKRQRLREKYEKKTQAELVRILKDARLNPHGPKDELVDRYLDWRMPRDGNEDSDTDDGRPRKSSSPRRLFSGGDSDEDSPTKRRATKKASGTDLWGDDATDSEDVDSEDSSSDERARRREKEEAEEKLADLDRKQLQRLCAKNKLKDSGTTNDMRRRLLKHFMENKDLDGSSSSDADDDGKSNTYESVRAKYESMTRSQLKKLCRDSWLDEGGTDDEMIEQLVDYEKPPEGWDRPGKTRSPRGESPQKRARRRRKEYESMSFDELKASCHKFGVSSQGNRARLVDRLLEQATSDESNESSADEDHDELAEWRRAERKLRSELAQEPEFELRKICKDKILNPKGSKKVLIDRIVENDLPKPEAKIVESNPVRRALREKFEKKPTYELARLLHEEGLDRNGTKEELIVRLLDRQCPDDHLSPSHDRTQRDTAKYNRMTEHELQVLCEENGLSPRGSKKDLVRRLADAASETSPRSLALEPVSEELDGRELRRRARDKYEAMTPQQLRSVCDQSWVDPSGSKEDMIKRLIDYDASINDWPADTSPSRRSIFSRTSPSNPPAVASTTPKTSRFNWIRNALNGDI